MNAKTSLRWAFALLIASAVVWPVGLLVGSDRAQAASCWWHNGSLMRLEASGNQRWIYYENPKQALRASGVRQGTLLFNGRKNGNWYSGTARRFSKFCPATPLEYFVEGPVAQNQRRVTVHGVRKVYLRCRDTGRTAPDTLVFTYAHQC
ncbi:MAG: hypothetical protein ABJH63_06675 [Rhizobiaceae bacterium]